MAIPPPVAAVDAGRRRFLRASALVGAAALLPRCGRAPGAAAGARPVRYVLSADPLTFNFALARDQVARTLGGLVSDALVGIDARLEIVPRLARAWEWSGDHRRLTFRLRDDVRWHDGQPVTAGDVVFTWRSIMDAKAEVPDRAAAFNIVTSVTAPDARTVVIDYERSFAPALSAWAWTALIPRHRPPRAGDPPLGCGPYRLASHERNQRLVLEAVPGYYGGTAGAPRLEFEVLRDYATRLAALRAGRIDLAPLMPEQAQQIERDPDLARRFAIMRYRVLYYQYIAWRMDGSNPFFADVRVRRAMTLAIDRAGYVARVLGGSGEVATTSFHPDQWAADSSIRPLPHDPEAARALLAEAGWRAGKDGVLARGGTPFEFPLAFPSTSNETQRIAAFVAANLRDVGVVARLEPLEWAVYRDRTRAGQFQAMLGFWYLDLDPDPYELWHSSEAKGGANYAALSDPAIDRWIEDARVAFDRTERERLYHLVGQRLHELQPDTFLLYPRTPVALDRRLDGVVPCAAGLLNFWPGPFAWTWRPGTA